MTTPNDVYPLATKDGRAIPLDLVKPLSYFQLNTGQYLDLDPDWRVMYAEASGGPALLAFRTSAPVITSATAFADCIFLPWGQQLAIAIPEEESHRIHAVALSPAATIVRCQVIECWQAINQPMAYVKRF